VKWFIGVLLITAYTLIVLLAVKEKGGFQKKPPVKVECSGGLPDYKC
tara:strand:- start:17484 stop:17624 length:141 start_codon:yes stop_codon:yes gene_type:complete